MLRKAVLGFCVGVAITCAACKSQIIVIRETNPIDGGGDGLNLRDGGKPEIDADTDPDVDATVSDSGKTDDASIDAATTDSSTKPDSSADGGKDSAADTGPIGCFPEDVSTFVPAWKPRRPHQNACTQAQIDTYKTACLGVTSSVAACTPFTTGALKICGGCIRSTAADPTLGPLISHSVGSSGYVVVNVAGCVSIATNDPLGTGCAGKIQANEQCSAAACTANCPVVDDASLEDLAVCVDTVSGAGGGCEARATEAECADVLADAGGAAAACFSPGGGFDELYASVVPLFCLAVGPIDAGGD